MVFQLRNNDKLRLGFIMSIRDSWLSINPQDFVHNSGSFVLIIGEDGVLIGSEWSGYMIYSQDNCFHTLVQDGKEPWCADKEIS